MALGLRLGLGFVLVLVPLLFVVLLAGARLREMQQVSADLVTHGMPRLLAMQELVEHAQGHGAAMAALLTAPRSEREHLYPALDAESAAMDRLMAALAAPPSAPPVTSSTTSPGAVLAEVDEARHRYRAVFAEVGERLEAGDASSAAALFTASGRPSLEALMQKARTLRAQEQQLLAARQAEMAERIAQAEWQLAVLSLAALGLAGLLAWRSTTGITRPMRRLADMARRLAAGDYTARTDLRATREIERVATALNGMADAVAARDAEVGRIAFVDATTGLPNRAAIRRHLGAQADGRSAVIVLDLARLGAVNDVMGYESGNRLLRAAADHLLQVADGAQRGSDSGHDGEHWRLGCLGGGVFVLAGRGVDTEAVQTKAETLTRACTLMLGPDTGGVDLQFVAGLALAAPLDTTGSAADADRLLRDAEQAVGVAKASHRTWSWHRADDPAQRQRQLNLLGGLRRAAAEGELQMWLQPKWPCVPKAHGASQIEGFEAMVRWRHPQWGWVSPAEFVPFAERAGHVGLITDAMLSMALAQLAVWRPTHPAWHIAVNVSTADLLDPGFDQRVRRIATQAGAPLHRLRLEITESRLMQDADRVLEVMCRMREAGVRWSIDDFGTGYSSLAYLQRLPVDELKIDRSFVTEVDLDDTRARLLRTIVDLARSLQLKVTAEGVERPEELSLLADAGCDCVQGYLLGRPMPAADAATFTAPATAASPAVGATALRSASALP